MNLFEKFSIILIILILINQFTEGSLTTIVKEKMSTIMNNFDTNFNLDKYLQSLITNVKFNLNKNNANKIKASNNIIKQILEALRILNSKDIKFSNLSINDDVYYYEYPQGKLIKPFIVNCLVKNNNNNIGNTNIEIIAFLNNNNSINILDIKQIKIKPAYKFKIKKSDKSERSERFDKYKNDNFEDLFIKPSSPYRNIGYDNDTDNSLIPSIIEFSNDNDTLTSSS